MGDTISRSLRVPRYYLQISKHRFFSTIMKRGAPRGYPESEEDKRKRVAPSNARNKQPILDVITSYYPPGAEWQVLEVASGTGEHCAFFAKGMPKVQWQPTETAGHASLKFDPQDLDDIMQSINAYCEHLDNVHPAVELNASEKWAVTANHFDAVLVANMVHIAPFSATLGLFQGSSCTLRNGGLLFIYGPFAERGKPLSKGNYDFDAELREKNSMWGLCEVETLVRIAAESSLTWLKTHAMPANNLIIVFKKTQEKVKPSHTDAAL